MNPLTCISVSPEYAYFIAAGRKTFETRSGPPCGDMRPDGVKPGVGGHKIMAGQRIGVAATAKIKGLNRGQAKHVGSYEISNDTPYRDGKFPQYMLRGESLSWPYRLPTSALVATAVVDYCVPIEGVATGRRPEDMADVHAFIYGDHLSIERRIAHGTEEHECGQWEHEDISNQLPFGYWNVGGWAWHLSDVVRVDRRCPLFCDPTVTEPLCPACKGRGKLHSAYQMEGLPGTRQGAWALDFTVGRSLW